MLTLPKAYIKAVLRSWGSAIAGPSLAFLGIVLVVLQQTLPAFASAGWAAWLTIGLAGLLVFVAQYGVWKHEYEWRVKAESELNASADIRGVIRVTILNYNPFRDQTMDGSGVLYSCSCANHGHKPCEISRASFTLTHPENDAMRIEEPLAEMFVKTVPPGGQFLCDSGFNVRGVRQSQLRQSAIEIRLIDSLGTEYLNTKTITADPQ